MGGRKHLHFSTFSRTATPARSVLAERTIALAQLRRRRDPASGYDTRLIERVESLLPILKRRGINPGTAADLTVTSLLVRAIEPIVDAAE